MSHMSGLQTTLDLSSVYLAEDVIQSLNHTKDHTKDDLSFKPGTQFSYSHYNFQVVGAIIESVVNDTYQNYTKNFYTQLNMNNTFAETRSQIIEHRPRYYEPEDNHLKNTGLLDDLFPYEGWWPSVGMVSNVDDLLIFGNAMIDSYKGANNSNYAICDNELDQIHSY